MQKETESIRWFVEKSTVPAPPELLARFREEMEAFVFFHLGSDADVEVRECGNLLRISFEHKRINPFVLELSFDRISEMGKNPSELEHFLLDYLTRYRKS